MIAHEETQRSEIAALAAQYCDEITTAVQVRLDHFKNASLHAITKACTGNVDVRDAALQQARPAAVVPKYGELEPLGFGERILIARTGLWLEVVRPWLELRWPLALHDCNVALPYGDIEKRVQLRFGKIPPELIRTFVALSKESLPNEAAAYGIWHEDLQSLTLQPLKADSASPGHIKFQRPVLPAGQSVAIDLHSHGAGEAFFSTTDDADDSGEIKIAGVVGRLQAGTPTCAFRLCAAGLYIPLAQGPVDQVFKTWWTAA